MQQSGFNDMQILQQTIMFKQLQELQRKQLQQLGDARQQSSINQFSATAQQAVGGQVPLLINGTPVSDSSSQVFMNLMQRSSSPAGQGVPNRIVFPQDQNQAMHSMGIVPQQPDVSLHGTPVGSAIVNQYAHMQGMSRSSGNMLNKASNANQTQNPVMQSTFSNPFPGEHDTSKNVFMSQGGHASKHGFPIKNAFGQTNESFPNYNYRQEQVGNLETMQQKTTQHGQGHPQISIPLDPLEQKILYNMDDDSWDAGFGRSMDIGAGVFGSALEQSDYSGALQSGSWSALMNTAVAEASSCDTGVQEEWSGLTFQSTELSADNQPSKFMDEERQQRLGWANSNLQSASSNSKPFLMLNDPGMSPSFPGLQQSGFPSLNSHEENRHQYDSHKSFQKSPGSAGEWSDYNPQQKSSNQTSQPIQQLTHSENTWAGQNYEHPESYMNGTASHNKVSQMCNTQKGDDVNGAMDKGRDLDGYPWTGQMEQLYSRANNANQTTNNSYDGASDAYRNGNKASYNSMGVSAQTVESNSQNTAPQTSKHMLELLHKVDHSRENSPVTDFCTTDHNSSSDGPKVDGHDSCIALPSQRFPNSSSFLPRDYPQMVGNANPSLVNPEVGVNNQGWLDSSSPVRSLPPNEFSQRARWDEKSNSPGQTNVFPNPNMQAFASGLSHVGSQFRTQQINALVSGESSQATLTDTYSRFPPFNIASSQYISQQASTDPFGQRFPAFDSASLSQPSIRSSVSPKSGMSARNQNTWKSVPASRLSSAASPIDPAKNSMEAASLASLQGRTVSSDLGACSTSSQGSEYGGQPAKHRSRQEVTSEVVDTLQSGGLSEDKKSGAKHILSESNQDSDRVLDSDNHALTGSERNLESFGQSRETSQTSHQKDTLLHQMQAMKSSAETDSRKTAIRRYKEADSVTNAQQISDIAGQQSMYDHSSRFRNQTHVGADVSRLNTFPSGDPKMLSFLTDTREEPGGKALSRPILQPLQGVVTLNKSESQNQTKGTVYNHTENSQVSSCMAPTWFKHYDTFRNGHMQFTPGKSYSNLPIYAEAYQRDPVIPGNVGSISPSGTDSLVTSENISSLDALPSDLVERVRPSIRAKKRKSIGFERIPWHKEVTQGSQRLQDISTAEQDWACATNRLTEKIENGLELIGAAQPVHHRPKRRLILTTQLIQQLLRPAPASVLLGDAGSRNDSVTYVTARLALGDACSLTYGSNKDSEAAQGNSDMISEKRRDFESYKRFTQHVEDFTDIAKKLEKDFLRLESASILDIRVECQDLERYSVMNRFAKFHMRGQVGAGASGISPQSWVTVVPMPRNLPEEAPCFSL